jgi:DNA-binding winged helix-turn-helix (wHTH) protein/Tol biopolymer transport system component
LGLHSINSQVLRVPEPDQATRVIRFGVFEVDLHTTELRRQGVRIRLPLQSFQVLEALLRRPGELVTRKELKEKLWPADSFGDFEHGLNAAVNRVRDALGDSSDNPRFVETLPRRGYRFLAPVNGAPQSTAAGVLEDGEAVKRVASPTSEFLDSIAVLPFEDAGGEPEMKYLGDGLTTFPTGVGSGRKHALLAFLSIVIVGIVLGLGIFLVRRTVRSQAPEFQRLTVRQGTVFGARFAPDGHNVIYSASWDGAPVEIFSTDVNFSGTRSLGFPGTAVLAVSSTAQMAVLQLPNPRILLTLHGILGQVPVTGGSPRQIAESVEWADWAPDGKTLAIVRDLLGKQRLEFPIGHVVFETTSWISFPRVSPKGDQIAFLDHPNRYDDLGVVSVVDLAGHKRVLSSGWESEEGLAWSPDGKEVWFSATETGLQRSIYAVDLGGHLRLSFAAPSGVTLEDIAPDGRLLLTRDEQRYSMMGLAAGATRERNLSWLDWSVPVDLSSDGNTVLFVEEGAQRGSTYTVAVRDMRGSPPVPLGEGTAAGLSPDGKWAAAIVGSQLVLLPTGVGTTKRIERGEIQQYGYTVSWLPDRKRILFSGNQPGHQMRCFIQDIDGAKPRPVTPEGVQPCQVSPDGKLIAARNLAGNGGRLYATDGGGSRPIPGLLPGEVFAWTSDSKFMYVQSRQIPIRIYRLDIATGQRQFFEEVKPSVVMTGLSLNQLLLSSDGRAYVYGYQRLLSELYLVKGLK